MIQFLNEEGAQVLEKKKFTPSTCTWWKCRFFWGGGWLEGFRNNVSYGGYQAKANENRQGPERKGDHEIGKIGGRCLWMPPNI